jgi:hypothetical protein
MAYTLPTDEEILSLSISYFTIAHRDPVTGKSPPLGPRSFLGQEARALASLLRSVLAGVKVVDDDAIPGVYVDSSGVTRTRNSSQSLDDWATTLGLPSSVAGVFGRKGAQAATGGAGTATGSAGTVVTTGAQLTDPSGTVIVQLRAGFTMPGGGSQGIVLDAFTVGVAGNLPVGTVLRWTSPPAGLASTVTLTTALINGGDTETDVALALRIVERLRNPLRGGTAADYRFWCLEAVDSDGRPVGITDVWAFPRRGGTGTIDLVIAQAGTGTGRDPGATKVAQVTAYIEERRPVGDGGFRVLRPNYFTALQIRVRVEPTAGNAFDWVDSQGASPLECEADCTGTTLIVDYTTPSQSASLRAAVDAGSEPRVQVPSASNSPIPFVARVLDYDVDTPASGKLTLTLDTELPVDPVAGDKVYAAGPAVIPVATAVLAYLDGCGPSRSSGYAEAGVSWRDKVTVAGVAKAAIDAVDADGALVCVTSPNVGDISGLTTAPGVLIKVGSGSEEAADVEVFDNLPGVPPGFCYATSVLVHKGGV